MRNMLIDKIIRDDHVSFAEVERLFEENGFEYKGDQVMYLGNCENLIAWGKWNEQAMDLVKDIVSNEAICLQPCQLLIYLIDGSGIDRPIAKRMQSYKSERWMPLVFRAEANIEHKKIRRKDNVI